jgi:hypothetical protein
MLSTEAGREHELLWHFDALDASSLQEHQMLTSRASTSLAL